MTTPEPSPEQMLAECRALAQTGQLGEPFTRLDAYLSTRGTRLPAGWDREPDPLTGADFNEEASDQPEDCTCGEPITYYNGKWLHIISEKLRSTGDHDPEPAGGFYIPDGYGDEEGEDG